MTITMPEPVRLSSVLEGIRDLLGDATFIGRYQGVVDTNEHDGSRWYTDPSDSNIRYQSVTWTIGSTQSAPWLMAWAAKLAAEQACEHWAEIGDLAASAGWPAAVAWLKDEAKRQRDLAAEVGTWHHDVLEALLLDASIPDPPKWILGRRLQTGGEDLVITQETLDRWAEGILNFVTDYRLTPIMAESTVCNPIEGYAARVDLGAEFPGYGLGLVDMKTGQPRTSVMAQLTAQMHATEVWLPLGDRIEMPRFEWGAVLHLRQVWERGYKLRRVPTGLEQWAWFRAANDLLKMREAQPDLERLAMYPPEFAEDGSVARFPVTPMIEDTGLRCARALRNAGLTWVHELAAYDVADIASDTKRKMGIKGVGPKAIEALRGLLADHDLTFADETIKEEEAV
jgi:hypothetical protein